MYTIVFIGAGSNIDPETNLLSSLALLGKSAAITGVSTFYRTPAIDRPEQPDYLNGVLSVETDLLPGRLQELLHAIERAAGRVRTEDRYAARTLDLDILLYGDAIVRAGGLEIPDPDIPTRPFLAAGLLELAPALVLPGQSEPLNESADPGAIAALKPEPEFTRRLKETLLK